MISTAGDGGADGAGARANAEVCAYWITVRATVASKTDTVVTSGANVEAGDAGASGIP